MALQGLGVHDRTGDRILCGCRERHEVTVAALSTQPIDSVNWGDDLALLRFPCHVWSPTG